jgi:hypothetical protein
MSELIEPNVIDLIPYLEERFHDETGLPPDVWTSDGPELAQRMEIEKLRGRVGAALASAEIDPEKIIWATVFELCANIELRVGPDAARKAITSEFIRVAG